MPIGGSFDDKLFINHLLGMTNGDERDDVIALRIARVNHSCQITMIQYSVIMFVAFIKTRVVIWYLVRCGNGMCEVQHP